MVYKGDDVSHRIDVEKLTLKTDEKSLRFE